MGGKYNEGRIRELVSQNLKRYRSAQRLSQMDLAIKAGLTHNFINDIEGCKKGISVRTLVKLANSLEVEPYQIFLPPSPADPDMAVYAKDLRDNVVKMLNEITAPYLKTDPETRK